MYYLAIIGLLTTVIAAILLLKDNKNYVNFDLEKEKYDQDYNLGLKFTLALSTILIMFYFIYPSKLLNLVSQINII